MAHYEYQTVRTRTHSGIPLVNLLDSQPTPERTPRSKIPKLKRVVTMNDENESYLRALASFHAPFGTINPAKTNQMDNKTQNIANRSPLTKS